MPQERNFFAVWVPPHYKSGRVMVAVPGTSGSPYEALKDEIPKAGEFDYMAVAIHWNYPKRGGFLNAKDLYRNILQMLTYLQDRYGNDLSSVAYTGFSRGAAISYEVAYLDADSEKIFDLFIAHSGGIPKDFRVEAKNSEATPDRFFYDLANHQLGEHPLQGTKFFLYSGDQDESWGITMSEQVEYASQLIKENGGEVVEYVRDPQGTHAGFLYTPEINEKAIRHFMELTPGKS